MVEPDARRVLACGCLRAGAPSAGKCTSRGRRGASPGATLPPRRATACAGCSSRLRDGTGGCINQRETRTACSRATAIGLARRALQTASAGDAGGSQRRGAGRWLAGLRANGFQPRSAASKPNDGGARRAACGCLHAGAPCAGKCTCRGRHRALPPRRPPVQAAHRVSDITGGCINQGQTRTAGSLQLPSGSRAEHCKLHQPGMRRSLAASAAALRPRTTTCRRPRGAMCCTAGRPPPSQALACCARRGRRRAAIAPTPVQRRLRPSATSAFPNYARAPSRRPC